jgi:hypothetical protein
MGGLQKLITVLDMRNGHKGGVYRRRKKIIILFLLRDCEAKIYKRSANHYLQSLKKACRSASESTKPAQSATQQEVSKTLRQLGLWVEDEALCPKSGYSIDMLVHVHDSSLGGQWRLTVLGTSLRAGRQRVPPC